MYPSQIIPKAVPSPVRTKGNVQATIVDPVEERECGYALFQQAILARDEDAWIDIGTRYRAMMISWVSQCSVVSATDELCEDIADRALARAWRALTPARFANFPNLPALMAYLRTCATATVIDIARAQSVRQRTYQKLAPGTVQTPEQVVLDEIARAELWKVVLSVITNECERIVLVESFQFDLPPREILARHPDLFTDIDAVYMAKRHLIGRLQRNKDVRQCLDGLLETAKE